MTATQGSKSSKKIQKNQGKKLAFPCFPLAESGLFNGLQRIQVKKSGRASTRVSGCEQNGSTSQASIISGHPRIISKFLIFAKENQSDPRRTTNVLVAGSHRLELAASRWRFNTIAFFIILIANSLLLLAALTAIQRPLILALIDERPQGRRGAHGHRSIADLYEPARRQPLQHHADGIA